MNLCYQTGYLNSPPTQSGQCQNSYLVASDICEERGVAVQCPSPPAQFFIVFSTCGKGSWYRSFHERLNGFLEGRHLCVMCENYRHKTKIINWAIGWRLKSKWMSKTLVNVIMSTIISLTSCGQRWEWLRCGGDDWTLQCMVAFNLVQSNISCFCLCLTVNLLLLNWWIFQLC